MVRAVKRREEHQEGIGVLAGGRPGVPFFGRIYRLEFSDEPGRDRANS
jgi:hypothetical protein